VHDLTLEVLNFSAAREIACHADAETVFRIAKKGLEGEGVGLFSWIIS